MSKSLGTGKAAIPSRPTKTKTRIFRKILCPIDFDRISLPALKLAISMARQNDATLFLLYVVPASLKKQLDRMAHDNLLAVARKWLEGKIRHRIVVRSGKPVEGVLKATDEFKIDAVVMATHGRTGASHTRLGSVTEEVVRRSTKPVMTIRPG